MASHFSFAVRDLAIADAVRYHNLMKESRGRVALVTGGNHGIGAATARALAVAGGDVFVQFLRYRPLDDPGAGERMQDASDVLEAVRNAGCRAAASEIDLSDPNSVPTLFDEARGRVRSSGDRCEQRGSV